MLLWGLLALPAIWWLLQADAAASPQSEVFPPLKILARVLRREETPSPEPLVADVVQAWLMAAAHRRWPWLSR
jgi:hypothetical protein